MIHGLVTIPLGTVDFEKELNIIKQIAINNGFSPDTINKILHKKFYKRAIDMVFLNNKESSAYFKVITYNGAPSIKISKYLKKHNIKVAFKTNNSLGKFIKNITKQKSIKIKNQVSIN